MTRIEPYVPFSTCREVRGNSRDNILRALSSGQLYFYFETSEARFSRPVPVKSGGLNGSVQQLLAVYLPDFEVPKYFLDSGLSAVPLYRVLLEHTLTGLFV